MKELNTITATYQNRAIPAPRLNDLIKNKM
jgi:hypothetical protein